MSDVTIYHDATSRTSRNVLALIQQAGIEPLQAREAQSSLAGGMPLGPFGSARTSAGLRSYGLRTNMTSFFLGLVEE